jgi:ElaB/YqjD/DUF883 family membrane-anchored ribosome-binding protein
MDKIERLRQILNVANEDTVSYKQLSELLKGLAVVITKAKDENRAVSDELKALFRDSVSYLKGEHEKLISKVENLNDKRLSKLEQENRKVLEKALEALDEIKSIVVVDGIDGKDGKDGKDGSPDTRDEIVDKINSGKEKDKKIEAKQITGLPEFTKEVVTREIGVGFPETPLKAGTGITITKDSSGANVVSNSITDHGSLTGLGDDDHPQYVLGVNTHKLTVSATEPTSPSVGDLWVQIS